jgi:hypothetical protein
VSHRSDFSTTFVQYRHTSAAVIVQPLKTPGSNPDDGQREVAGCVWRLNGAAA